MIKNIEMNEVKANIPNAESIPTIFTTSVNKFVLKNDDIEQTVVDTPAARPLTLVGNNSPWRAQGTIEKPEIKVIN